MIFKLFKTPSYQYHVLSVRSDLADERLEYFKGEGWEVDPKGLKVPYRMDLRDYIQIPLRRKK